MSAPIMPDSYRTLLFSTVFLTGAAVLIFEVAAVRALSPFFGTSIYVVSSVLTVILAALSLGYLFGGKISDRRPEPLLLYKIIATSGLLMNLLHALSLVMFPLAGAVLPITYGPLLVSILFFFIPAFLLGIDSPFVIKLLSNMTGTKHNGETVGTTFFWSTIGSIIGSLASGFLLIPFLGLRLTFITTATTLSLFACCAYLFLSNRTSNKKTSPLSLLLITLASTLVAALTLKISAFSLHSGTLLHTSDGFYSHIEIREIHSADGTRRSLYRGPNHSGSVIMGTTTFAFPYTQFSRAYSHIQEKTSTMLVIGGGAYSIPRTLLAEDPDLMIDVVEIEPRLLPLAQQYFELPTSDRMQHFTTDARTFLRNHPKKYDVIFADVYQSGHFVPIHLVTQEFFTDIKNHLSEDGVFMINLIGISGLQKQTLTGSILATIHTVFPETTIYNASLTDRPLKNIITVSRSGNTPATLPDSFRIRFTDSDPIPAPELQRSFEDYYPEKQTIFTDDRAPIEPLIAQQIIDAKR